MDRDWIRRVAAAWAALLSLAFLLAAVALAEPPQALANFDDAPGQWHFSNGREFPGSSGRFTIARGASGRGGRLQYAFHCVRADQCGAYVAADLRLDQPVPVQAGDVLSFALATESGAKIAIRLIDGSGQTLQIPLAVATLEQQQETAWRTIIVPLDDAAPEHWGGANSGRIEGGLTGVSFLARGSAPDRGAISLDDIRIVNVREQTYDLSAAAPDVATITPAAAPILGVNLADRGNIAALDPMRAVGVEMIRTDLFWESVETAGTYDFSAYDPLIDALEARDMRALLILDYGHPDHGGGGAVTTNADRAAYVRFGQRAADQYRNRPVIFEIWNEPDVISYRHYRPDTYARLVRETVSGMRDVDRGVQIIGGGLSWANHAYYGEMLPALRDTRLNAIALHPYRTGGPESAAGDFAPLRAAIAHHVRHRPPLWITEWGFSASRNGDDGHAPQNRRRQGVLLTRQLLTLWALRTPLTFWYEAQDRRDQAHDGESNFGLLDLAGNPKPAYEAMRTFSAMAQGRRLTAILQDMPALGHGVLLEGRQDKIYALWTEAPGGRIIVNAPRNLISAHDAFGVPIASNTDHRLVISEADGPIYLRVPR